MITDFSKSPLNLSNCSIHWVRYTSLLPGDTPAEVEGPALASRLLSLFFSGKMANLGGHRKKNAFPFVSDVPMSAASPLYSL